MDSYNQNQNQYQTGGYADYQGPPEGNVALSPNMYAVNNQPQYQDPQNYPDNKYDQADNDESIEFIIRKGFIVKTYGILISQLVISTIFIALTFFDSIREKLVIDTSARPLITAFLAIFLIVTIVVFVMFTCFRDTARKVPINYILLFSYTLCMSFYLMLLCAETKPKYVISALILTCGATVALTVYAWTTKRDFTYCGGFLFAFVLILILSAGLFFWCGLYAFYCGLGVLLYSLYLIYDTQLILGKFRYEYNIDDYCFAALNLYIDIVYLFIKILQILGNSK